MPRLKVRPLAEEDIYKDIVRIPKDHRKDTKDSTIEESTVCWIEGTPHRSVAVMRGYQISAAAEIRMDERMRDRLGVQLDEIHDFKFRPAGWCGELAWAWKASETGYRVASRLAVVGLILGILAFVPFLAAYTKWLWCWFARFH